MADGKTVTIQVNRQQYRLIKELKEKGKEGKTDEEIVRKGFAEWGRKKTLTRPS